VKINNERYCDASVLNKDVSDGDNSELAQRTKTFLSLTQKGLIKNIELRLDEVDDPVRTRHILLIKLNINDV
jgi:hypothetical protein